MTKQDIISKMAEFAGSSKVESDKQLTAFLQTLEYAIENKEEFKLTGHFGMKIVERSARVGRNPQSGEEMQIPAKNAIKTSIGKKLKELAK
jgi:DNA-binding protein HU-beta